MFTLGSDILHIIDDRLKILEDLIMSSNPADAFTQLSTDVAALQTAVGDVLTAISTLQEKISTGGTTPDISSDLSAIEAATNSLNNAAATVNTPVAS